MDDLIAKYRETEAKYRDLKEKLGKGQVTAEQVKAELMRLMVQDETGKYWMLGGKTGKWYIHNGTQWQEADPYMRDSTATLPVIPKRETPSREEPVMSVEKEPVTREAEQVVELRNYEIKVDDEEPVVEKVREEIPPASTYASAYEPVSEAPSHKRDYDYIECRVCKSRIPPYAVYCNFCGANQKELADKNSTVVSARKPGESELLIKSIKYLSFMFFLGGLGLIFGVIFGATFGVFKYFLPDIAKDYLPLILGETRGGIAGGMIFAAIGGIGGFFISAILSFIIASIYNLISFIFGGIRFKVKS